MSPDFPVIAVVTNADWNALVQYAQRHDIETGRTQEDCYAECFGTIQVCEIVQNATGPNRMGHTRVIFSATEPADCQTPLPPEIQLRLNALQPLHPLLVQVLDKQSTFDSADEEAALMPIAEARLYFAQSYEAVLGRPLPL